MDKKYAMQIIRAMEPTKYVQMHDTPWFHEDSIHVLDNIREVFTQGNYNDYATPIHICLIAQEQPNINDWYLDVNNKAHQLTSETFLSNEDRKILYSTDPIITPDQDDPLLIALFDHAIECHNMQPLLEQYLTRPKSISTPQSKDDKIQHLINMRRNALRFIGSSLIFFVIMGALLLVAVYPQHRITITIIWAIMYLICIYMASIHPAIQYTKDIKRLQQL